MKQAIGPSCVESIEIKGSMKESTLGSENLWLNKLRKTHDRQELEKAVLARWETSPWPHGKIERYRSFPLKKVLENSVELASMRSSLPSPSKKGLFTHFVLNNMSLDLDLSDRAPKGVWISSLQEAGAIYSQFMNHRSWQIAQQEQDFFALMSCALAPEGIFIYVQDGQNVELPIELTHLCYDLQGRLLMPKIQIVLGQGAHLNLLWKMKIPQEPQIEASFWFNGMLDLTLQKDATLNLTIDAQACPGTRIVNLRAHLDENAHLHCLDLSEPTALARHDFHAVLAQPHARADFEAAGLLSGKQRQDHMLLLEHRAPNCMSTQRYKTVLDDQAFSRFSGKIYVHPQAQKTDAYQISNALILSDHAAATSQPNLEIFADDVKASHGATTGEIPEETLFYLMSRGLSKAQATKLFVQGFLEQIYKKCPVAQWSEKKVACLQSHLSKATS